MQPLIKVLFALIGGWAAYSMIRQVQAALLLSNGIEVIELIGGELIITSRWGPIQRQTVIKLASIRNVELLDAAVVPTSLQFVLPRARNTGAVMVKWGRRSMVFLGAYMNDQERTRLFRE